MALDPLIDLKLSIGASLGRLARAASHLSVVAVNRPDEEMVRAVLQSYHKGLLHARQEREAEFQGLQQVTLRTAYVLGYERGVFEVEREETGRVSNFMQLVSEQVREATEQCPPLAEADRNSMPGVVEPVGKMLVNGVLTEVYTFDQLMELLQYLLQE